MRALLLPLALSLVTACSSKDTEAPQPTPDSGGLSQDPLDYVDPPGSCAFSCDSSCEPKGYECPALSPWQGLPHADACGGWDQKAPAVVAGKCKASLPTGEAAKRSGTDPDDAKTFILPTGDRAKPAGAVSGFTDFHGQFPANVVAVPGSDLVVVVDGGIGEQSVRLVDTTKIGGAEDPVVGREKYAGNSTVNYGAVVVPAATGPARLWVSGGAGSILYAFTIDLAAKTLTRDVPSDIKIVKPADQPDGGGIDKGYLLSGMSLTPDGKRLVIGTQNASARVLVVDVDPASPTYKTVLKTIALDGREIFTTMVHPADTAGKYAFASIWDRDSIAMIDLTAGTVIKTIMVGKAPAAFAPIGTRYLAVTAADQDTISIVDTLPEGGMKVSETKIAEGTKFGWAPSGAAYDDANKRLYVTLSGLNAVAAFDVSVPSDGPPTLVAAGMLGTEWWPTAVAIRPSDSAVVVVNGKGKGTGANPEPFKIGEGNITEIAKGSIQINPKPDAATLTAGKSAVDAGTDLGKLAGAPKVDCGGAAYDFPVPETNTEPSKLIKHVVYVIKENKTFDAVFGDLPGVDGDPKLVMAPGRMDTIFANQRKMAKDFTVADNYYTSAEQSIQGHVWTAFGRSTDFTERSWLVAWGRGFRLPLMGVSAGIPVEGSIFQWLEREKITYDDMGEIVGGGRIDSAYPGKFYAMDEPDTRKACYLAARTRLLCDLKQLTYMVTPNDHTSGGSAGRPTVETYVSIGDEGTGMILEAVSHSPEWASTLVVVTMDDPQDGGDHVDAHPTPLILASPWIKRNYVSKTHIDTASLHKLFAHIFGKSYPNEIVARAALPLDAFTSTPDYTPYDHLARTQAIGCNMAGTKSATTAAMSGWDFSEPDQAPGIGKQIWELMHDGEPPPFQADSDDDD
ncbi:MAG: bifunctional YncE family protein/alkaline phosphatase family protein [Polyangiales bacterium]